MAFKFVRNVGYTGINAVLAECMDSNNKTFLASFHRENGALVFRYYLKDDILLVEPVAGMYASVGYFRNDLTVAPAIVEALTLDGVGNARHPDGVPLPFDAGLVAAFFPEITNLTWVPDGKAAIGSLTPATINALPKVAVVGGVAGLTSTAFTVVGNGDGTITISGLNVGDKITIDGGTQVIATDSIYTTAKQTDGTHTVTVTGVNGAYAVPSKTVTTKIALLSAPLDWITANPVYAVGIAILVFLLFWKLILPMINGEPTFLTPNAKKSSSKRRKAIRV
ncbi:hypothetical protein [Arcicella lustrica]|uniref:Bacterial Ig-like domain-containing protein n=1 Tax=Arcicella lustrica TaxID=2984196 RepID=A0ABU5SHT5_9BACT|nr:hypothetical protein [Arcicella sp. DC25W]MEA5426809.1 hypothetical protein [Arcicella sp. DC25W]